MTSNSSTGSSDESTPSVMTLSEPAISEQTLLDPAILTPQETEIESEIESEPSPLTPACVLDLKLTPRPTCDHDHPADASSEICVSLAETHLSQEDGGAEDDGDNDQRDHEERDNDEVDESDSDRTETRTDPPAPEEVNEQTKEDSEDELDLCDSMYLSNP